MPSDAYEIEISIGNDFDVQFTQYAKIQHRAAARLITRLEAFAKRRKPNGDFIRGSGKLSIFVVPLKDELGGDGEAGLFARVDDGARKICPLRFRDPSSKHRWEDYEAWAEKILGI